MRGGGGDAPDVERQPQDAGGIWDLLREPRVHRAHAARVSGSSHAATISKKKVTGAGLLEVLREQSMAVACSAGARCDVSDSVEIPALRRRPEACTDAEYTNNNEAQINANTALP